MRLISLELNDFRSFYGPHHLEFAAEDDKRVTIFHGENGAGKTNLLNSSVRLKVEQIQLVSDG